MSNYSLDSQPYAVLDDPRRLQVVSLPGRQALLQRMTVDIGTGGATPPDRLRVLLRAEQDRTPASSLRVRVTDLNGVDLAEPQDIPGSVLRRFREWQFVEVPVEPTVGFGFGNTANVIVWFSVSERGPGWEVAAPSTGENVPGWRGPLNPNPDEPVFGRLLTFPAGAPVLVRVSAAVVLGETGPVTAGELVAGSPVLASHNAAAGFRNPVAATVTTGSTDAAVDGDHVYLSGSGGGNVAIVRKYLRDPYQWVNTVGLGAGELFGRSITTDAGFGYVGTAQNPARIVKVDLDGNMSRVGAVTLRSGEGSLSKLVNDGTHVYGVSFTTPGRVVKVRMSDMLRVGGVTLPAGEAPTEGIAISPDGTTLYVVTFTDPLRIVRVATVAPGLETVRTRQMALGEDALLSVVNDGTHAYYGAYTGFAGFARIVKVNLASMTRVGALVLGSGENLPTVAVSDGTHGYYSTGRSPERIVKVNLASLTRTAQVNLLAADGEVTCGITDGTHAYFGTNTMPARIVKVDLATMTRVGHLTLNAGEDQARAAVIDGTDGYFATENVITPEPDRIVKVDLTGSMSRTGSLLLNAGETQASGAASDGTHVYFTMATGPASQVVKVNLASFTRVAAVSLPGERFAQDITLQGGRGFVAIEAGEGAAASSVVEIDLATMTRVRGVDTSAALSSRTITSTATHAYTGRATFTDASVVQEIALESLGRIDSITYPTTGLGNGSEVDISPDGTWGTAVTFGGHAVRFTTSPFQFTGDDAAGSPARPAFRDVRIDSEGVGVYGVSTESPVRVRRWEQSGGDLVRRGERVFPAGVDNGFGMDLDDRYVFVAPNGTATPRTARITSALTVASKVDPVGLTNTPLVDIPYFDSSERPVGIHVAGDDVFVASADGVVAKYNSTDGSRGARFVAADPMTTLAADGTHVYVTDGATPSEVSKLAKADLTVAAQLTLNAGEQVGERAIAEDATHLYYGTTQSPATVVKVAKSTLTRTAAVTLNTGENVVRAAAMDGTDLYVCTDTTPIRVVKIDTTGMTRTAAITLAAGENSARAAAVQTDALTTSLYVLTNTLPARVVEIDLGPTTPATFARKTAVTLNADETNGQVLLADEPPLRVWAGMGTTPGRVVRLGKTLASTGDAFALQINSDEDAADGLDYDRNFREDADVSLQFGQRPLPPEEVTAVVDTPPDDTGCVRQVDIGWVLPDDECVTVTDGGFVEVQRETPFGWVTVFRVFDDVTRTVTDVEVLRNRTNRYRLRIVNDAGFVSDWTAPVEVEVESPCCGYVFSSNQFPDRSVWYDDLGDRSYRFVEQVEFVEFEGRDGSVPLRPDADRLDEFDVSLMVAGFGVFGGTTDTAQLAETGRRVFRPLTTLTGGKRTTGGDLLRTGHVSVTDNEGHQWFAEVQAPDGQVNATSGRYTLRVRVKETTRDPVPVELRATVAAGTSSPASDLPLVDPGNLLDAPGPPFGGGFPLP